MHHTHLSDLSNLCPFADICDYQGREPPEKRLESCCLPCSCNATCGQIGNCCDKHENTGNMCHKPIVNSQNLDDFDNTDIFLMIDKCLDGRDCTEMDAAAWGPLYPVYDFVSHKIFYNAQCASCNGVNVVTDWEINLECNEFSVTNEHMRRALRGKTTNACMVKFTPPRTMDYQRNKCLGGLIDRCNVTGSWNQYNAALEEACYRWNSPIMRRIGNMRFANVFCMLCNGVNTYKPEGLCVVKDVDKTTIKFGLTLVIDYIHVSALVEEEADNNVESTGEKDCDKGMVKHVSKVSGIHV